MATGNGEGCASSGCPTQREAPTAEPVKMVYLRLAVVLGRDAPLPMAAIVKPKKSISASSPFNRKSNQNLATKPAIVKPNDYEPAKPKNRVQPSQALDVQGCWRRGGAATEDGHDRRKLQEGHGFGGEGGWH
ncbi:hypothetical protein CRG98_024042 [Punica granatum]|uniref:Uncharacterized protein n=1 Tax=Punica granatum TaxID=22663 RepID=A0A2I0JH16_PUNGR|nr:hypothetical protein CRG98_024042 [Punica granatum]